MSGSSGPNLLRSAKLTIDVSTAASAVARSIVLDAVPAPLWSGDFLLAGASVTGPMPEITFCFRTATGEDVAPPQTSTVVAGRAEASFMAPAPTTGLRLLAIDAADPANVTSSPAFAATRGPRLLTEAGGAMLTENGGALRH